MEVITRPLYMVINKLFPLQPSNNYSEWDSLPDDIIGNIISLLNVEDVTRMSYACKSWQRSTSLLLSSGSQRLARQHPWLLYPNKEFYDYSYVTFLDLFEGKIRHVTVPEPLIGGECRGSSKGWLLMETGVHPYCDYLLFDPIGRRTVPLPPLSSIPNYWISVENEYTPLIDKVEVYGSLVAGVFFGATTLAFCKIGGDSWTLFGEPIKEDTLNLLECIYDFLISDENGLKLYALHGRPTDDGIEIESSKISLFGEFELEVKMIPHLYVDDFNFVNIGRHHKIFESYRAFPSLLETSKGELLVVLRRTDLIINKLKNSFFTYEAPIDNDDEDDDEDEEVLEFPYQSTRGFEAWRVDRNTGHISKLGDGLQTVGLEEDVIFTSDQGCFSVSSLDFKEGFMQGNTIYFLEGMNMRVNEVCPDVCRESGIFDFKTGKMSKCIPSIAQPWSPVFWFTPTFF